MSHTFPVATTRYCGQLDRYDEATGYHVTYDDGDEETIGEIDGRDDVRFIRTEEEVNRMSGKVNRDNLVAYNGPVNDIPRDETPANETPASELAQAVYRISDVDDQEQVPTQCAAQDSPGQPSTGGSSGYLQTEGEDAGEGKFRVHSCSLGRDLSSGGRHNNHHQQQQQQQTPGLDEHPEHFVVRSASSRKQQSNHPEASVRKTLTTASTAAQEEHELHFSSSGEVVRPDLEDHARGGDVEASECQYPDQPTQHDISQFDNYHPGVNDLVAVSYGEIERAPSPVYHPPPIERHPHGTVNEDNDRRPTTADVKLLPDRSIESSGSDQYDRREEFGACDSFADEQGNGEFSLSADSTEWTPLRGPELLGLGSETGDWPGVLGDEQVQYSTAPPQ